ncbi:replication initiation protein [Nocardioidaceae bacterium SCSIO 66511]|nr:replication initiation protein [Nocardioidaceae bacterium SCSIO 66511]
MSTREQIASLTLTDAIALAEHYGVCTRPLVRRLTDRETGVVRYVAIPCGSTRAEVCAACADKARRLRQQQCRDGWHLRVEPAGPPRVVVPDLTGYDLADAYVVAAEVVAFAAPHVGPLAASPSVVVADERYDPEAPAGVVLEQHPKPEALIDPRSEINVIVSAGPDPEPEPDEESDQGSKRRTRSTRRLEGYPDLPKKAMSGRTVGRQLTSPSGNTYAPSTWLTLTLGSYGPVHSDSKHGCRCGGRHLGDDPLIGTPVDPDEDYNYREAALDALHFSKLIDRFWQNLRRCAGWKVQYFACVEPQKRLALHLHAAVRGGITASLFDAVVAATYHALWWPPHDDPVYAKEHPPVWDEVAGGYVDPDTGVLLPTWDQALDRLEEADAAPAYVLSFGSQSDRQWFLPGTPRTDKRIGYLTKYLTKSIAETYSGDRASDPQQDHRDRLVEEVRWLPCSPECTNWLRYGVQPKDCDDDMAPGECERAAHHPDNLGHGGRRVLVSRQWTGKTLDKHRADRAAVVRAVLAEAGIETPDRQRYATSQTLEDGTPRYDWERVDLEDPDGVDALNTAFRQSIIERIKRRNQYEAAKRARTDRDGPPHDHSAIRQRTAIVAA